MAKTSLGKVGILPKGEYSSATQYLRLDIVSYNGGSYLCIKDCVGIDVTNKEYWLLIAQKGDKGDIGEKGDKGDAGKDFSIYKTYASISAMESDASNVPEGEFVLIASNVEDEDNAKLYVKGENSFVYLTDLSGATGIKGEKGEKGDKPVNGVDYNTPEEKEEFKNEVVSTATTEVKQNIETIKEEAIQEFNSNASTKTNEYNDNTTTKLSEYNTNANSKVEEYNSNATQKTNTFNENATTQTETFNNNATSKTNDFNSNASTKTDEFNTNYEEKLESINEASTSIEQERVISDGKYARALKTPVTDVESTQIYAENDVVENLKIKGAELTQETREGYNRLDISTLQEFEQDGVKLTKENGIVTLNGKSTATSFIDAYIVGSSNNYEEFLSAGTYLISGITGEALSPNFGILVVKKHTDGTTNTIIQNSENKVLNVNEGDTFRVFIRIPQNLQLSNVVIKPMIIAGTEEKPYEEYGASPSIDFPSEIQIASEQNITINETNIKIPLVNSAIGQYADTIDRENNVQNKVIQELILTGNEDFKNATYESGEGFYAYYIKLNMLKLQNIKTFCNYFKQHNEAGDIQEECFTIPNTGNIVFIVQNYTTIEEFKIKLQELYELGKPVKVYYVAETPTKNSLQEEIQTALSNFKLYQDLNNVAIDGGSMSFIYNKSLSKTIDEMQDEIQSKDTLIQNLTTRVEALEKAQIDNVTEDLGGN